MELIKKNEYYILTDSLDNGWKINGNVSIESEGSVTINVTINNALEESIGNIYYYSPVNGNINISYNTKESLRDEVSVYADTLIDQVLERFK